MSQVVVHSETKESSTTTNHPTTESSSPQKSVEISSGSKSEEEEAEDHQHLLPTREGWATPLTLYNKCWLRSHTVGKFMAVRDGFKPRGDDVILATHPKSGTNWLKALAFAIFNRSRFSSLSLSLSGGGDHPLLTTHPQMAVPFIGFSSTGGGDLDHLEALPSPRLLSTHLPLSLLPPTVSTVGCRVVYLCRDPKDAFVSRWHFENVIGTGPPVGIDAAFAMFCEGCSPFGPFWEHYLEYWRESSARPREVMFLRYEEMASDTLQVARKLASFLGVPFTQEEEGRGGVAQQIVSFCSFDSLRNLQASSDGDGGVEAAGGKLLFQRSSVFRKGKVGDWTNHLTEEMAAKMDRLVEDKFQGSGLVF